MSISNQPTEEPFSTLQVASMVGDDAVDEVLHAYLLSLERTKNELSVAFEQQNCTQAISLCHRLKSPSRFIGAEQVATLLTELEHAYKNNQDVPASMQTQLFTQLDQLKQAINAYLELQGTA